MKKLEVIAAITADFWYVLSAREIKKLATDIIVKYPDLTKSTVYELAFLHVENWRT